MTHHSRRTPIKDAYPVFAGLRELALNDQDVGEMLSLTALDVAAWRHGRVQQSNEALVCLTHVLADVIDQKSADASYGAGANATVDLAARITRARDCLLQQRAFNAVFSDGEQAGGAGLFRDWQARRLKAANEIADTLVPLPRYAAAE